MQISFALYGDHKNRKGGWIMLHNRLAMSKKKGSQKPKKTWKNSDYKKEIEELMQNYKYLYSDQIYRWFDIDDKFVVKNV